MEAEARLINLSLGGVLVEAAGDRSELFLQNDPKLTLRIKTHCDYFIIEDIPVKLARLNTIDWHHNYKPSVMRMVYVFVDLAASARARLGKILETAEADQCAGSEDG